MRSVSNTALPLVAALAATHLACAADVPSGSMRRVLHAMPDLMDVTLSPDGRHIAYLAAEGGRTNLWIAPAANPTNARALIREPGRSVFTYSWSGDADRLIYQTGRHLTYWTNNHGGDDYVIYALDPASGASVPLSSRLDRRAKFSSSPRRPREVFISPSPRAAKREPSIIDIRSGRARGLVDSAGFAPVYADRELAPRLALRPAPLGGIEILVRAGEGAWRPQWKLSFAERLIFELHGFDRSGATAFVTSPIDYDSGALVALDLASGKQSLLAHREDEAIASVLLHPRTGQPIAYKSRRLRTSWTVLDSAYRADFEHLAAAGARLAPPESDLSVLGRDARDRRWLVSYEADVLPKRYFLYDRRTRELIALFPESKARQRLAYSAMHPVLIRARDGVELSSYLTLPGSAGVRDTRPARPVPMVLWVHGGPQSRETWGFDPRAQWLASRGYAALSVNFRGSSGFGKRFIEAGYGEWGGKMQNDLIDAVHWAVREGIADPARVAIMGLSHGGYATLSAMAGEPGMFACGVETVGPSDLSLLLDTVAAYGRNLTDPDARADIEERLARDRIQFGGDERTEAGRAALAARSPITHADAIRAPVLITHGLLDDGVVPAHSERMVAALERRGSAVVYLAYPDEGHGLALAGNKISQAAITEAFLARCLGGAAEPFVPADFADSSVIVRSGATYVPRLPEALATRKEDGEKRP